MKKLIIIILLLLVFTKLNSQNCCYNNSIFIGDLRILPDNYVLGDTLKVALAVSTLCGYKILAHTLDIDSNQIKISFCFSFSNIYTIDYYFDTIALNVLPIADYNLTIYGYSSCNGEYCDYSDTVQKSFQFSVINGINKLNKNSEFSIYLNPASEKIRINYWKEGSENYKITISNLQGQVVVTKENFCFIDISGLDQGIYLLRLQDRRKIYTKKLLIN